ncbi:TPA: ornithine carbamoyltransferase, partial [Candidatus Galligastranaerophilus intestinigallinarum]|nr:ornithine carbamoyltransferase [Candidatus Galligastranaerophilus intestinigallinarum]
MKTVKNLKGKHFINLEDFSSSELKDLINLAIELKKKTKNGKNLDLLKSKNLVMYFSKPSLRTRLSFEIGMAKLGGKSYVIKQDEIILGKRESVEDT